MPEVGNVKYIDAYRRAADLYTPTRFEFRVDNIPSGLNTVVQGDFSKEFQFSVETVFFPGRNISSEPIKLAGPVDEIPYEATYSGDLDLTVRVSDDFQEKLFFESWMDLIINQRTQNLAYPDTYRCDFSVTALNRSEKEIYQLKLTDGWPKSTGRVSVGQGLTNSIATMQLQLAFRRFFVTHVAPEAAPYIGNSISNPFIKDKINQGRNNGADVSIGTTEERVKDELNRNYQFFKDALLDPAKAQRDYDAYHNR